MARPRSSRAPGTGDNRGKKRKLQASTGHAAGGGRGGGSATGGGGGVRPAKQRRLHRGKTGPGAQVRPQQPAPVAARRGKKPKPDADVFEAEDSDPDEVKHTYRYDVSGAACRRVVG